MKDFATWLSTAGMCLLPLGFIYSNTISAQTPLLDEKAFVTADALLVRERPTKNSTIVGMIPYGTLVSYSPAAITADSYEWVFSQPAGGYIAKAFLAPSKPSTKKTMILSSFEIQKICFAGIAGGTEATLELSSGSFLFHSSNLQGAFHDIEGKGSYTISPGQILLQFVAISKPHSFNEPTVWEPSSEQFNLKYNSDLHGFVLNSDFSKKSPDLFPVITTHDLPPNLAGIVDSRECSIHLSNCPNDPPYNSSFVGKEIGYFCLKPKAGPNR